MHTYRQWFREQLKAELKSTGRKRMYTRILRANNVKVSLDKLVMMAVKYN